MSIDIVRYQPGMESAIARLQTHMWSGDPARNAAYFRWKYLENPYLDGPIVLLAMDGDRAVAMRGAFGSAWEVNRSPTPVIVPCMDDMVVDPTHRNRGVMRPLVEALTEELNARGFRHAFSLSAAPVTLAVSLAMGWRSAGSTEPLGQVNRRVQRVRRLRARLKQARFLWRLAPRFVLDIEHNPFRQLDERWRRRIKRITAVREPRIDEMAALVARIGGDGRIRHVRDAAYFAWRLRNPLVEYRFFYWDERRLEGYLVLRRVRSDRGDRTRVSVVDWEAEDVHMRLSLLDEVLARGGFPHVDIWSATLSEPVRDELHKRGFRPAAHGSVSRPGHHVLVRTLGESDDWSLDGRPLLDMRQWDLRLLNSMAG